MLGCVCHGCVVLVTYCVWCEAAVLVVVFCVRCFFFLPCFLKTHHAFGVKV